MIEYEKFMKLIVAGKISNLRTQDKSDGFSYAFFNYKEKERFCFWKGDSFDIRTAFYKDELDFHDEICKN